MLHEAFRLHELKQRLAWKIESIATAGNLFFLGTSEGKIIVHEVFLESYDVQCVYIHTSKHKQPVRAIIPIAEKELLIALVGDVLSVHRLHHITHEHLDCLPKDYLPELSIFKGVKDIVTLHIKRQKNIFSIAVLQRKKISIYELRDQSQEFVLVKDNFLLPDGAKTLLWVGRNIVIGFRKDYVLMDVVSGTMSSLYSVGRGGAPLLVSLDPVPEILVGSDTTGVRALRDGSVVPGLSGVPWTSLPVSTAYVHPFLLTIHDGSCIDVRVPFLSFFSDSLNTSLWQSISLKNAERISQRSFADFDASLPTKTTLPDALRKDITIVLNGDNSVFLLELVPLQRQVNLLASTRLFEAALLLCQLCANEVDKATVENLKTLFALWSFSKMDDFKGAMLRFRDADVDPRLVINIFPEFLTQRAKKTWCPMKQYTTLLDTKNLAEHMQDAVAAFIDYALSVRPEYISAEDNTIAEAVDTAIVKAYVILRQEQQLLAFLCEDNVLCSPTDLEAFLFEKEQWVALTILWKRCKEYSKVLRLLYTLGTTGERLTLESFLSQKSFEEKLPFDDEFLTVLAQLLPECIAIDCCDTGGLVPQSLLAKSLLAIKVEADELRHACFLRRCIGVVTTIHCVRLLPWDEEDIPQLVERYTLWILANVQPQWSVVMFSTSTTLQKRHYAIVLSLLKSDMSKFGCVQSHECIVEWISAVFADDCNLCADADMHDAYWQSLAQLMLLTPCAEEKEVGNNKEETALKSLMLLRRQRLHWFLRSSHFMNIAGAKMFFEQQETRGRMYSERAIIYQRLKLHEEAIRMFLYEVQKQQEARDYVMQVGRDGGDAFKILLYLLLNPANGHTAKELSDAIDIVNTCEGADPLMALPMLPDNTPVSAIMDFMRRSFRDASTQSHSAAVYANVLEACIRRAELTLAQERSRRLVIDLGSCCVVCGKKLRSDVVFMCFPNGVVVHQTCTNDEHVCPVTYKDFRQGIEPAARWVL